MSAGKIILGIVAVIYGVILINIVYSMVHEKSGFGYPIWIQVILGLCFLAISISNLKSKHYIFGSLFASAVVLIAASIVITSVF